MATEIDLYNLSAGELQPYNPGEVFAPHNHQDWANTDVDLLREDHRHAPQRVTLFGNALPAGTTEQQVQTMLHNMSVHYGADFQALGFPADLVSSTVTFYKENALKPPQQVRRQHSFKLPDAFNGDWLAESFGNYLQGLPGTQKQKQQLLTESIRWLAKLVKQLSQTLDVSHEERTRTSTPSDSDTALASLSEKQFEEFLQHNENVKLRTRLALEAKYGQYEAGRVIETANRYLSSLSAVEQQHFQQFSGPFPWSVMSNLFETVEFLYHNAIGAANIPTSGADLAAEIRLCENAMRTNRSAWLKDDVMQSRYRELLRLRDGG